ncbi:unnamed protein product [Symbiodinium sp. CCMP2592]|nr:unnamed protein product [Symbiodinium sp. CCMP2592]
MAEVVAEYLCNVLGLVAELREKIQATLQSTCHALLAIPIRSWCIESRQCHKTCMLRSWYLQTGDRQFDRSRCGGRCVAWDLSKKAGGLFVETEFWHGYRFRRSRDVDMSILGEHSRRCPLAGRRNMQEGTAAIHCNALAVPKETRKRLEVALKVLAFLEQELMKGSRGYSRMALSMDMVVGILDEATTDWRSCDAEHSVDPLRVSQPKVIQCSRSAPMQAFCRELPCAARSAKHLFEVLTTAAVLQSVVVRKSRAVPNLRESQRASFCFSEECCILHP